METIKVKITLIDEMLGSLPNNQEVWETYIAKNAPDRKSLREEIEMFGIDATAEKTKTIFFRKDGEPVILDYQIRGQFKNAASMLSKCQGTESSKLKAFKKTVDGMVFVYPRTIKLNLPKNITVGVCQRPLRASTPQGERVALAFSETVPEGTWFDIEINYLPLIKNDLKKLILEWLDYGKLNGLGQWRNSGKGRFVYEIL
ncbi:MAG: hypothetical protein BV456_00655 [Thermoplasmata archaeon M8B2D]|nr:MAG: hypothetical protein BV456_00655 [Thermoplasmata archaeon M8B2D]